MNKTIIIAGGTAVVSLALGGGAGYLLAKKHFDGSLDEILEKERKAAEKRYSLLLQQAREGKPNSPADIPVREDEEVEAEPEKELTEEDERVREEGNARLAEAAKAMTDYQSVSTALVKDGKQDLVESNIFTTNPDRGKSKRKSAKMRDPGGRFASKDTVDKAQTSVAPYAIDEETFLQNLTEYTQESLLWFAGDNTLVQASDVSERVDPKWVGEKNLQEKFPSQEEVGANEPRIIFVRNQDLEIEYHITRTDESLTEYLFGGEGREANELAALD